MGYAIVALTMVLMLVTDSITAVDSVKQQLQREALAAELLASDMLRTANAVNDWQYSRAVLPEGTLDLTQFSLSTAPDHRINAAMLNGRLWVWTADQQGLRPTLMRLSSGSALALSVTGGHLLMSDGVDMNLSLPAGVAEGNVVYLN
ncbi:type IV pilus biogenesis protein PilM [Candidatus Symbiopectobacterium sp.]|uniref:type IV pilus biogenesis protein PilM n=1 Tax=Candidatus Symbiopectobacterium sp. TaxID=2816440 RepID=UPI0025C5C8E0|nr:type IV pilus biogenesis protein PilM [Candidatus Symbiopectobacterium sp.]